jgi:2-hydroxycyclohexanecarboxyl-CoA dehydrogenase
MNLDLGGKRAIVTGGASNIGRAISLAFGAEGAITIVADNDAAQGERTVAEIKENGGEAHLAVFDVTDLVQVKAEVDRIEREIGPINVLVNNVGWNGHQEFFLDLGPERWEKSFRLNLFSHFSMTQAVLPYMVERRDGSIVSISSDAAFGDYRVADYGAMKAGVLSFTRSLAMEYGRYGIRANSITPGMIIPEAEDIGEGSFWSVDTGLGPSQIANIEGRSPLRRRTEAADVAWATLFFASGLSRQLTGQLLSVSGGFQMPR